MKRSSKDLRSTISSVNDEGHDFGKGSMVEPKVWVSYLGSQWGHEVQVYILVPSSEKSCLRYVLFLISSFYHFVKVRLWNLFTNLKVRVERFRALNVLVTALSYYLRMNDPTGETKMPTGFDPWNLLVPWANCPMDDSP